MDSSYSPLVRHLLTSRRPAWLSSHFRSTYLDISLSWFYLFLSPGKRHKPQKHDPFITVIGTRRKHHQYLTLQQDGPFSTVMFMLHVFNSPTEPFLSCVANKTKCNHQYTYLKQRRKNNVCRIHTFLLRFATVKIYLLEILFMIFGIIMQKLSVLSFFLSNQSNTSESTYTKSRNFTGGSWLILVSTTLVAKPRHFNTVQG